MKPYLIRLFVTFCFMGMVAFAITGTPVRGQGAYTSYLPLTMQRTAVVAEPPLSDYQMITTSFEQIPYSVVSLRADGSTPQVLAQGDLTHWLPAWSPNNRTVAFLRAVPFVERRYDIMLMNVDGSNPRAVATMDEYPHGLGNVFTWTVDSRYLLINHYHAATDVSSLLAVDMTTNTLIIVLESRTQWQLSPTGTAIAFLGNPDHTSFGLWVAPLPTGTARLISPFAYGPEFYWTPGGDALLVKEQDETLAQRIVIVDADGTNRRILVEGAYTFNGWLEEGDSVLLAPESGIRNLFIASLRDGTITPLTNDPNYVITVGVSPRDSSILYYTSADSTLYLQSLTDTLPRTIPNPDCVKACAPSSVTWAFDGSALVFINTQYDNNYPSYTTYAAYYVDLTQPTLTARKLVNFGYSEYEPQVAFFPRSAAWISTSTFAINADTAEIVYYPSRVSIAADDWRYRP